MTLDDFLLVIYEMGYRQPMGAVNLTTLEDNIGSEYRHLFENADAQGYLKIAVGQLSLTSSGKLRVGQFQ